MTNTGGETPSYRWRLLAYMAGDNNLSADMAWALQSMKEYLDDPLNTGKTELQVIAQYDPNGLKPRELIMPEPARVGQQRPAVGQNYGKKPGEEDGSLDEAVKTKFSLNDVVRAVSDDLNQASQSSPPPHSTSAKARPPLVTPDLVACRFADLSTEAMLRRFIEKHLGGGSRRHMLVLSGHGAGVSGDFLTDEDPHSSLLISRLGKILTEVCKKKDTRIDILGMDSCLMGMAEVACEVKDRVDFVVGAEGFVNNTGWPYHRVLKVLAETENPETAAGGVVEKYAAFYQDFEMSGSSTQIAALNLKKLPDLTAKVKTLATVLKSAFESVDEMSEQKELNQTSPRNKDRGIKVRDAVILAHWYAQSFKWGEYADLWDFCNQLGRFLPKSEFEKEIEAAEAVKQEVEDRVVIRSCYCGPDFQHAHGIAIYFPWSALAVPPSYRELKFATDTEWHTFLDVYLKKTRRLRRGDNGQTPRRFGLDINDFKNVPDLLGSKTGSHYAVRSGSPYGTRSGSPYGTKSGSPYGTRMLGGTLIVPANFQNVPDGYLRQDLRNTNEFTGDQ